MKGGLAIDSDASRKDSSGEEDDGGPSPSPEEGSARGPARGNRRNSCSGHVHRTQIPSRTHSDYSCLLLPEGIFLFAERERSFSTVRALEEPTRPTLNIPTSKGNKPYLCVFHFKHDQLNSVPFFFFANHLRCFYLLHFSFSS